MWHSNALVLFSRYDDVGIEMRNSAPSCQYFLSTKKREGKFSFHHLLQLPFSCLYYFSARANRFPSFVCALIRLKPIPSGKIETLYRAVHAPQQIKDLVTRMCAFSSISCVCVAVKAQRKTMHRLEKKECLFSLENHRQQEVARIFQEVLQVLSFLFNI